MVSESILDEEDARAVAVLATATISVVGREAPVVARLQQLLHQRDRASYDAAAAAFDKLDPALRERIAHNAPEVARRRMRKSNLPGLLGVLHRG